MTTTHQPTPTDHAAPRQAAADSSTENTRTQDLHARSDAQVVALLRQWVDDYQAHPEDHSHFPSIARTFFEAANAFADEEKRRTATHGGAGAVKSDLTQPVGTLEGVPTTLDVDDSYTVFRAVLYAVQTWESDVQVLPNEAAHRALIEAAEALQIMARAQLTEMGPVVQAHRDDDRAAQDWASDRWMARSQLACTPAGSIITTERSAS